MVELSRRVIARFHGLLRSHEPSQQRVEKRTEPELPQSDGAILDELCPKVAPGEWPEDLTGPW